MSNYSWLSILNESEISCDADFEKLREQVISETELKGIIEIRDRSELLKVIASFQKARKAQSDKDDYFISEKHRLAFCILKHEGVLFDKELGITKKLYIDKKAAKVWRNKILSKFHPDKDPEKLFKDSDEVTQKVNKMYSRMVGEA